MFVLRDRKTKEVCNEGAVHYEQFQDALNARAKMARSKTHFISPYASRPAGGRLRGINELFDEMFEDPESTKSVDLELQEMFQILGLNDAKLKDLI